MPTHLLCFCKQKKRQKLKLVFPDMQVVQNLHEIYTPTVKNFVIKAELCI